MRSTSRYWFPSKRYGWGWGIPTCWQGWAVLIVYIVLFVALAWRYPPHQQSLKFAVCAAILTLAFVAVCWLKGEPPHWRWGDKD
jgi:hypothetical protein